MDHYLRYLNHGLASIGLLLGAYILFAPFLPVLGAYFQEQMEDPTAEEIRKQNARLSASNASPTTQKTSSQNSNTPPVKPINHETSFDTGLRIGSINLDSRMFSSNDNNDLWQGVWHNKTTGNPIDGGNMVITAHRFLYTGNQNTFYHLPEVEKGSVVMLSWKGKVYPYEVTDTFEVDSTAVNIEDPTENHQLTLYTCTPLWTSDRRHVVIAEPIT